MFLILSQFYIFGQFSQQPNQIAWRHIPKHDPMTTADHDLHPLVDIFYFIGHIITRYNLFCKVDTVHTAKRGFYNGHEDVSDQSNTKTKQRGAGIAQCIDFRIKILRQALKGGFNRPASSIQLGDQLCARRAP